MSGHLRVWACGDASAVTEECREKTAATALIRARAHVPRSPAVFTASRRRPCPHCRSLPQRETTMATGKEIEHLAKLMKKIDIAMLATIGAGGHIVSRPLSTQCASFDGERVWFMTERDTPK